MQSIFIFLSIGSQTFYNYTSMFRNISEHHQEAYGRLRGNAISGYQFFGMATMYGYVILYYILRKKYTIKNILILLFLCSAMIISGRYAATAIIIGFFVKMFSLLLKNRLIDLIKILSIVIILVSILFILVFLLSEKIGDPILKRVFNAYLMSPVKNLISTGNLNDSSLDNTIGMYDLDISDSLLFGDGRYTALDGRYYGHIDIGYYRIILYYGIIGLLFYILIHAFLLLFVKTRKNIDIKIAFFIFFVVLNLKGDVQIYSNNILPLVIGFILFSSEKQKDITTSSFKSQISLKKYFLH
jgi:hypothetical protein